MRKIFTLGSLPLLLVSGCATHNTSGSHSFAGARRMASFANGFTATLSELPATSVYARGSERERMRVVRRLAWATGACTPEKNFRIVERRVSWGPSTENPPSSPQQLVAAINYVGICIRDRGCIPPAEPTVREEIARIAIRERQAGGSYYEGCRWIDREIDRIGRQDSHRAANAAALPITNSAFDPLRTFEVGDVRVDRKLAGEFRAMA